jgi:trimethylamine--corrinoid protein Co-methyltransferase
MSNQVRRGRAARSAAPPARVVNYRQLTNPFVPQRLLSDDEVAALHDGALQVLEDLGMEILLPEAVTLLARAGARVQEGTVRIGRDMVAAALASAPGSILMRAASPAREITYAPGALLFTAGGGCPNVTDHVRGRRAGDMASYREVVRLTQAFDVIHKNPASPEPQDIPAPLRHYAVQEAQMTLSDKPYTVYARGRAQARDCFEMIRLGLNLSEEDWARGVWASTVINTNSPRKLDTPMAQGIIDFARAGQMTVITPFCLAGAMAPVTVQGAMMLQHAEALACITLAQIARPGAPVSYGGFGSNVDLKSGAPAFGTPTHVQMQIVSGQLARHIGLPWRSAAGSAGMVADAQGATENVMGLWGALMAGAQMVVHAAGWLEGGLSFGYEKFLTDLEAVQMIAELCVPLAPDPGAYGALAEVAPGGHFFAAGHTMSRYDRAFYAPLLADLGPHGSWAAAGARDMAQRATPLWQEILAESRPLAQADEISERLAPFIARRSAEGGAPPVAD